MGDERKSMKQLPFFVYGTLLPEQPNHHLFDGSVVSWQEAILPTATLYDMGSYPMLLEEGYEAVVGAIIDVRADAYETVLWRLDTLEGYDAADRNRSHFLRKKRQVQTADGQLHVAWVYIGRKAMVGDRRPIGGNWVQYSIESAENLINNQRSELNNEISS